MAEYGDPVLEFGNLSELVSEFHVINQSNFPFRGLNEQDLRNLYGMPPAGVDDENEPPYIPGTRSGAGNYVATAIQAKLRKEVCRIPNRTRSNNLAAIFGLPLELILEIFAHLHPLDLYNMIRTTKNLRALLLIRKASSLWETVFYRHPDFLPCPSDVSPPKWVSLIFGTATCDICHCSKAMVDFTYRQRLCDECLPKYWQYREDIENPGDFLGTYPDELESLWRLVRYTYRSTSVWNQDLFMRGKEIIPYLSAIVSDAPNAREDYENYKAKTRATVLEYLLHVRICNNWSLRIWRVLEEKYREKLLAFCSMSWSHLIKLGHNPSDVEAARPDIAVHFSGHFERVNHVRFSKKELHKHLPELEAMVKQAKEQRILEERRQLISRREDKVVAFYERVCQPMLEPGVWEYLPHSRHILNLGPVSKYTRSASDGIGDFSPEELQVAIINFVNIWIPEKKRHLVRILAYSHPTIEPRGGGEFYFDESILELATAVFYHPLKSRSSPEFCSGSIMIGWEEVGLHLSCGEDVKIWDPRDFFSSNVGYAAIVVLLRLLGLNPDTALVRDVTGLNKRFVCMNCPWTYKNRVFGTYAMDWKESAVHAVAMKGAGHETPYFALLTDELTDSIIHHEPKYPHAGDPQWSCKHCSEHFNPSVRRKEATLHVKASHAVIYPVEGTDFFYRRNRRQQPRKQYFLGRGDNSNYCCLVCEAPPTRRRLWIYDALMAHLRKLHTMEDAVEGIHWKRLQLISKTTDDLETTTVKEHV